MLEPDCFVERPAFGIYFLGPEATDPKPLTVNGLCGGGRLPRTVVPMLRLKHETVAVGFSDILLR